MKTRLTLPASLAVALLPLSAGAAPLMLTDVPAKVAAARLSAKYGIDIVLMENAGRHVNVSVEDEDDTDVAGARLQTVNALANALRLDFTKTITVNRSAINAAMDADTSAVASGPPDPTEAVDSAASVPFGATRLRTREAITLIAGVDGAFAHIARDIGGFVTLSKPTLTVSQAEAEIAKQTGTTWKAVYTLAPRERVASLASPLIVFPDHQWEAQQRRAEEEAEREYAQEQAAYQANQQAAARQQALPQRDNRTITPSAQGVNNQGMYSQGTNGYYPNGYGSYGDPEWPERLRAAYGSNGYGSNGYGSNGYGVDMNTSGNAGGNFPNHVVGGN